MFALLSLLLRRARKCAADLLRKGYYSLPQADVLRIVSSQIDLSLTIIMLRDPERSWFTCMSLAGRPQPGDPSDSRRFVAVVRSGLVGMPQAASGTGAEILTSPYDADRPACVQGMAYLQLFSTGRGREG